MLARRGILTGKAKIRIAIAAAIAVSMWGWISISGSDPIMLSPPAPIPLVTVPATSFTTTDALHDNALWQYLRAGLHYVEASGRDVPIDFMHPGGVAFGPLALTRIAIKDVLLHCEAMSDYTIDDVLRDKQLYEKCARLYADLLLRHYLKIGGYPVSREDLFEILQKAWFLGPTLYKRGEAVPASRLHHAAAYKQYARQ